MKLLLLGITVIFVSKSVYSSVDKLFLKSLKSSKLVEIIDLSEKKVLVDLEARTTTLYPSIDLLSTHRYGNNAIGGNGNNPLANDNEIDSQLALSLQHRLFQGGAEFTLSDYRKILPKQALSQKEESLANYYAEFSSLYFQVSSTKEEKDTVEALLKNLRERVSIVKKRTQIGRDRKADLLALESQLFRLEADLYSSQVQLNSAKIEFINYSGLSKLAIIEDKTDPLSLTLNKKVELDERPELQNLKYSAQTARLEAKIEKASYYPQVDLGANYFLDKSRLGRNDWEVSLNISLNLLDFSQRSANVQSKNVVATINQARFEYAKDNASRSWNEFVDNFEAKKKELSTLRSALSRSRKSYIEQLKDVRRGLVTQIDVIRSLDDVINLEKLTIRSALEVKSLYYQANAYLGNYPKG